MADEISYVITIRDDTGLAGNGGSRGNGAVGGVAKTKDGEDVSGLASGVKRGAALGVAFVAKIADTLTTTYINRVDIRTGNTTLAQRLSFKYSEAKRGIAIGAALIGGIATGNPVAVIGAATAVISRGIDIAIASENIQLQRDLENISIQQANIRAGSGGGRAGRNPY